MHQSLQVFGAEREKIRRVAGVLVSHPSKLCLVTPDQRWTALLKWWRNHAPIF